VDATQNILLGDSRLMDRNDFSGGETTREEVQNTMDGNLRSLDDWSARTNSRPDRDIVEVAFHLSSFYLR